MNKVSYKRYTKDEIKTFYTNLSRYNLNIIDFSYKNAYQSQKKKIVKLIHLFMVIIYFSKHNNCNNFIGYKYLLMD